VIVRVEQFVGIDVSAQELAVEIESEDQPIQRLDFANDASGHKALIKRLTKKGRTARVCLEATGNYSLDLALALHRAGIAVMVVNPKQAKRFAEAMGQRSKTDRIDAGLLREFARRMPFEPWQPPSTQRLQLRMLTRRIHCLTRTLAQEKNRLHAASAVAELSAAVRKDIELNINHLQRRLAALRRQAQALVDSSPELQRMLRRIRAIPGFGTVSALQILGELGALPPDMTARQWVAHAGLDPRKYESGTSVRRPTRMSRIGNRLFRAPLYMPALVAIRRQPQVAAFYQRLLARQKKPLQGIVAVMRKLLHAIFGMLRHDDPFDGSRLFTAPLP
jgi:transposase